MGFSLFLFIPLLFSVMLLHIHARHTLWVYLVRNFYFHILPFSCHATFTYIYASALKGEYIDRQTMDPKSSSANILYYFTIDAFPSYPRNYILCTPVVWRSNQGKYILNWLFVKVIES